MPLDHVIADASHLPRHRWNGHAGVFESFKQLDRPERQAGGHVHLHQQHGQFDDLVGRVREAGGFGVEHQHAPTGRDGLPRSHGQGSEIRDGDETPQNAKIRMPLQPLGDLLQAGQGRWTGGFSGHALCRTR
ncbi:hypothetical protein D9M68_717080 [compost metagenome]